jgi:mono/diheme cytochrome c family protein
MNRSVKRVILVAVAAVVLGLLLIQLVPYGHDHKNPPVTSEPNWDTPQTRVLAQRACYDCHSNETVWPWYSNIAPVSWLVQHDIEEGRRQLNFSTWSNGGKGREPGEAIEVVNGGWMPPSTYLITNPQARLSDAEKQALAQGLRATMFN